MPQLVEVKRRIRPPYFSLMNGRVSQPWYEAERRLKESARVEKEKLLFFEKRKKI